MENENKILRAVEHEPGDGHPHFIFWCPGCKCGHGVWVSSPNGGGAGWRFNGNLDKPTFQPSILVRSHQWTPPVTPENLEEWKRNPWTQTKVETVCHTFVTDGQIQFLSDCTHALAGKTVPMEPF